jgi:hypothetical protein
MRWRLPWVRKAPHVLLPEWLVRAHANALVVIAAAELMRQQPELAPVLRADLLMWARQAVEALKVAPPVAFGDGKILKFVARKL